MEKTTATTLITPAPEQEFAGLQLTSRDLFKQTNTVRIEHNGEHYCLRLTRGNKLILTK